MCIFRTWMQSRELSSFVLIFSCLFTVACLLNAPSHAWAAPVPTITTLAVSSGGNPITTVAPGSVVTLTATVLAGSAPVTRGQIDFCDSTANSCTDIHLLGTAQLTANGTATLKFRPGVGAHSFLATFLGTHNNAASSSTLSALGVVTATGLSLTSTTERFIGINYNGGNTYQFAANVRGRGPVPPTGTISFIDTSNANTVVGFEIIPPAPSAFGFEPMDIFVDGPMSVASGDFNGDGIPDLAVNEFFGDLAIYLGNGDGTFNNTANILGLHVTGTTNSIVTGDFDGDGKMDLALVNGAATILLGNGDGTFRPVANSIQIQGAHAAAIGDFNEDGNADLAVVNPAGNTIAILLGNGDGTFTAGPAVATGSSPSSVVAGDFNLDGKLDLAVTNTTSNSVTVLLGNGDGSFASAPSPATGLAPGSIVTADLNGDGKPDLAVPTSSGTTILLGNGDGTFAPAATPAMSQGSLAAIGDFNGDGIPDLAVTGGSATFVLLGSGDGTFAVAAQPDIPPLACSIAVADLDGDGLTDLVVAVSAGDFDDVAVQLAETGLAAVVANDITPVGQGTHLIQASYSGDSNYAGSSSNPPIAVSVGPDLSIDYSPINNIVPGGSGSGTVTFTSHGGYKGTVKLTCSVSIPPPSTMAGIIPPTCSISPSLTVPSTGVATVTLNVSTQTTTTAGIYLVTVLLADETGYFTELYIPAPVGTATNLPSFTLDSSPVSIASAGESGTSTITITPVGGYTGTIGFACTLISSPSSASAPVLCSVPNLVTISGTTPVNVPLNLTSQTTTGNGIYRVEVIAEGGAGFGLVAYDIGLVTIVPVTVGKTASTPAFALSNTPVKIGSPGASGTSTITVTPSGGFTGAVALSCTVTGPVSAVDLPTCSIAAPPAITGTAAVTALLVVNTTSAGSSATAAGRAEVPRNPARGTFALCGGGVFAALLFFALPMRRRRIMVLLGLLSLTTLAMTSIGCGGAAKTMTTTPANPGTTPGSYTVSVTATSSMFTSTTKVGVTVN